jgi:phospholipid/cholesterol/gamma-HCH transport system permease protein|tara:strand:- start:4884 stop:5669 length:786 start_codon:yes stop_codon:yes gene_type:complete
MSSRLSKESILNNLLIRLGVAGIFLYETIQSLFIPPYSLNLLLKQILFVGARSILVIIIAGLFVGMVIALQFYDTLVRFGSVSLLGSAVGLSLIRELGPVLTALMVIGRTGSAMCAEIGIMRVDNQIDALECMAIDPYRYLISPRILAGVFCVPILTAIFIVVGIFGGYFVGVILFDVSAGSYFQNMNDTVLNRDLLMGFIKSIIFGLLIVWISCEKGFNLHLDKNGAYGSEGVSRITTEAVVIASITILFSDYLLSALIL